MMFSGSLVAVQIYWPASLLCTEDITRLPLLATENLPSVIGEESFNHRTTAGGTLVGGMQSMRPGLPKTPNVSDGTIWNAASITAWTHNV